MKKRHKHNHPNTCPWAPPRSAQEGTASQPYPTQVLPLLQSRRQEVHRLGLGLCENHWQRLISTVLLRYRQAMDQNIVRLIWCREPRHGRALRIIIFEIWILTWILNFRKTFSFPVLLSRGRMNRLGCNSCAVGFARLFVCLQVLHVD
jgi:hypothetical protein